MPESNFEKIGQQAQDAQGKSVGKSDDQLRGDNQPEPGDSKEQQSDKSVTGKTG